MKRARDLAAELGISEGALVARSLGSTAVRLDGNSTALLEGLTTVGRCMALTRNESAVSEVKGTYGGIDLGPHAGQVIGQGIDLRVFVKHWHAVFGLTEPRRSIQIFDRSGTAVHKVYLEAEGDAAAWDALVAAHTAAPAVPPFESPAAPRAEKRDAEIDRAQLVADWDAMTDTHEFFYLLHKHGASRTQALRLAGESRARAVRLDAMEHVLHEAAESGDKIMIFVGNPGCLQVFSGSVHNIVRHGPWLNVMDPGFNLHLRDDQIATSWVVQKPTRAGTVSSLELFDRSGETIALVFRKRDDREKAEDPSWQGILARLPNLQRPATKELPAEDRA